MTEDEKLLVTRIIAADLDYPSVYMGGPSHNSLRKAERIVKYLIESKRLVASQCDHSGYKDYKSNGEYCPVCDQCIINGEKNEM